MTGDLSLPFDITAQLQNEVTLDATIDKGGYSADETSVAAGKAAIAAAITDKGVSASKNDSFSQLSGKIGKIDGEGSSGGSGFIVKYITDNEFFNSFMQVAKPNVTYISSEII